MDIPVAAFLTILTALGTGAFDAVLSDERRSRSRLNVVSAQSVLEIDERPRDRVLLSDSAFSGASEKPSERNSDITRAAVMWVAVLTFVAGSMVYVYRFRGRTRYARLSSYLRKSWPIFAPFNCLLYLFTRKSARGPVVSADVVPELALLRQHWELIRDEARSLQARGEIEASAAPDSPGYYDVGFRTFYKYGWRKFYVCWYGYTHPSAMRACPRTVELLAQLPAINGAMFSYLPPGGELTLHSDPLACSLRYHLGLDTPEEETCFIEIDGVRRAWKNGEDFLFDETYPHYARNESGRPRLILMCDVERPMHLGGRMFNFLYRSLAKLTVVPNTAEDRQGFASSVFARLAPVLQRSKELKRTNRALYRLLKTAVNGTLVSILLAAMFLLVHMVGSLA